MSTPLSLPPRANSPAPGYRKSQIRIACVQFDPKLGKVEENAAKVQHMARGLQPGQIDLLVLPEMALSGYMFTSPTSVLPYLEPPRIGPTSLLARNLARRLRCHVVAGYPEALPSAPVIDEASNSAGPSRSGTPRLPASGGAGEERGGGEVVGSTEHAGLGLGKLGMADGGPREMKELEGEAMGVGYNSAVVVGPDGDVVGNYRKTFRFETDKNWARDGDGFMHFDLPEPLGRVAVGICMDMNPRDFVSPWDAFELANYCKDNRVDMLVVPMAWLDPPSEPPNTDPPPDPTAPSESNLNYWAARLTPLHDPTPAYTSAPGTPGGMAGKEVVFVACNRVGIEEGTKFVGTSCVMTISAEPSRIELVECCNASEERVMVATVT